ncbi:hypothetical protein KSP40_PGU015317 [Platanthera guangdongensis]|uniref:Agenet domain-containing protein n=1 Tax=Platanthera guangdongensis TaxID=2320717 RepID=A0ABR2MF39_9ASPA
MRFKKGDKVEVLNKREDHAESWWRAEIISGYGSKYYVRYDRDLHGVVSSAVERAPRRAIRPRPPSAMGRLDWVPGDIVEVLNNFSWKLAKIVMFSGQESFFVRILGSPMELVVHSSCIRLRQCWQDSKWVALQKESAKCSDRPTNGLSKEMFASRAAQLVGDQFQAGKAISFGNTSQTFRMGAKKRPRIYLGTREKFPGAFRKTRTAEKRYLQGASALRSTRWNKGQSWRLVNLASTGLR